MKNIEQINQEIQLRTYFGRVSILESTILGYIIPIDIRPATDVLDHAEEDVSLRRGGILGAIFMDVTIGMRRLDCLGRHFCSVKGQPTLTCAVWFAPRDGGCQ
jgi:hypothetical protein